MYQQLGEREGIRRLVERFYQIMASDPAAQAVHKTHEGRELKISAEKLTAFLTGWTGGPPDYLSTYGHPRLRIRHAPFTISKTEADQWLWCMQEALAESPLSETDREQLLAAFQNVTEMLINRP